MIEEKNDLILVLHQRKKSVLSGKKVIASKIFGEIDLYCFSPHIQKLTNDEAEYLIN